MVKAPALCHHAAVQSCFPFHPQSNHLGDIMIEEVRIPEISENVASGRVVSVLVRMGDMVAVYDILIEFETE